MDIRFDDKVALITGASLGIGAATAIEFAKAGARVIVNYKSSEKEALEVVKKIESTGGSAVAVKADVSKADDVKRLVQTTVDTYGSRIDILVNNAGSLLERRRIEKMTEDLWDECMAVNVKSVYLCTQAVLPYMKKQRYGRIINLSSIAARNGGGIGVTHYSASKAAVLTMTKGLARELADTGITVNAIAPGVINTPFHDKYSPRELREQFKKLIPLAREGEAEEIAYAILFLASDYANFILGETIEINGGQLMD